ncbi:MAG: hypothetical protein ACK502_02735 [Alphaproteobacteria bacterium]
MKYQTIRKRLLVESLAIVGALALGAGVLLLLISMHDEYASENLSLQTKVTEQANELASMNDKYTRIQNNHDLYEEAKRESQNDQLSVSKEIIVKLLREYRKKYGIEDVSVDMSTLKQPANPVYTKKTAHISYSEVTLKMEALTDEDVYQFIAAIYQGFPGAVKITNIKVTRENKFSKEMALQIAKDGHARLVSAEVKFNWFGIEPIDPADGTGGKPNAL